MTESTCTCTAYVGERHHRGCALFPAVRQPKTRMIGHPSLYKRPPLMVLNDEEVQRRLHLIEHAATNGCPDLGCLICGGNPFEDYDDGGYGT